MSDVPSPLERRSHGRLILFSLFFSIFASYSPNVLSNLLLIDIGETFGVPVGIIGQMRTLSFGVGVIVAVGVGVALGVGVEGGAQYPSNLDSSEPSGRKNVEGED